MKYRPRSVSEINARIPAANDAKVDRQNSTAVLEQFRQAMQQRGIAAPVNVVADGLIQRCDAQGKPGKLDASYKLHLDGKVPAGGFQNYSDGKGWQNWKYRPVNGDGGGDHREAAREAARDEFDDEWEAASAVTDHKYLRDKKIEPHGVRVRSGDLLIPMRRSINGKIVSLKKITPGGAKKYAFGSDPTGAFFKMGKLAGAARIIVCEGFATGASIREATDETVVVAFDCGNLQPVAESMHKQYPNAELVIAADDDWKRKEGNIGLTEATAAALAVHGLMMVPDFGDVERAEKDTDFNDLVRLRGEPAIRRALNKAAKPPTPPSPSDGLPMPMIAEDFMALDLPLLPSVCGDFREEDLIEIVGETGVGKTMLGMTLWWCMGNGFDVPGLEWEVEEPVRTLYYDAEMAGKKMQERIASIKATLGGDQRNSLIYNRSMFKDEFGKPIAMPNLAEDEMQEWMEQVCIAAKVKVVFIDNQGAAFDTADGENSDVHWAIVIKLLKRLRSHGIMVFLMHHPGKNLKLGGAGSSKQRRPLDKEISMEKVEDIEGGGLHSKIIFKKWRDDPSVMGRARTWRIERKGPRLKFSGELVVDADKEKRESAIEEARRLKAEGKTVRQIAEKLDVGIATVQRYVGKKS